MSPPSHHSLQKFNQGDTIFKDGDPRSHLFVIQKGQIAIFKVAADGARLPLGLVGSGEYLGESGLIDDKPSHNTWAVALTDVEVIAIDVTSIREQLKSAPPWLVALTKGLAQKVRKMNEVVRRNKIEDESLKNAMIAVAESERRRKAASKP